MREVDPNTAPLSEADMMLSAVTARWREWNGLPVSTPRTNLPYATAAKIILQDLQEISARSRAQDDTSRKGEEPGERCDRCQGNGEIVTDWNRYMRGPLDENGEGAVAECPDCDGTGHVSRPLEAAPVDGGEAVSIEAVMVPKPALDWLMGADTDPAGLWFGEFPDDHPRPPGNFWWRKTFREICVYYAPRMLKSALAHPAPVSPAGTDAKRIAEPGPDDDVIGIRRLRHLVGMSAFWQEVSEAGDEGTEPLSAVLSALDEVLKFAFVMAKRVKRAESQLALTDKSGNAELIEEIRDGLNVTGEELLRIRNGCEGVEGDIKIWSRMLQQIVDHVRRLRSIAALSRSPAPDRMETWQPIETAPKDGTHIQLFHGIVSGGRWSPKFAEIYGDTTAGWYSERLDRKVEPTHWQPLPAPPALNKEEGE